MSSPPVRVADSVSTSSTVAPSETTSSTFCWVTTSPSSVTGAGSRSLVGVQSVSVSRSVAPARIAK